MALLHCLCVTLLLTGQLSLAEQAPPLLLPLSHVLRSSFKNKTSPERRLHLLRSASLRSAARHRHRRQVSLPLSPGGDYTLSFSLGSSKAHPVHLYMDTGSDLVWLPCAPFECILCEGKPGYPPSQNATIFPSSSLVPCNSPSCSAAHSSLPSSDLCAIAGCPLDDIETSSCSSSFPCPSFYYAYGDGSLVAHLRRDHLSIPAAATQLNLQNFTFGCATTTLAEPVGVAGFGRGILSLPAQLSRLSPHLGRQFSYCLASHSFQNQKLRRRSTLILGRRTTSDESPFVYTNMLHNPKHLYFYTVGLDAVSVGSRKIVSPPALRRVDRQGNGGVVVDSGTTFTMLPPELHSQISSEFSRLMGLSGRFPAKGAEKETGMGPCYCDERGGRRGVPAVVLHFSGNATVALPQRNYYARFEVGGQKVGCLMMMMMMSSEEDGGGGPVGTLGNFQQQGLEVIYDIERQRVGFARRHCGSLWDSLSNGLNSQRPLRR